MLLNPRTVIAPQQLPVGVLTALIGVPAIVYAGQPFFRSAWAAVRHGRTNMDVPISIGVLLAFGMSLYETIHHGAHAYFDAAVSLVFFLLIGRTLDYMMRERARQAVTRLRLEVPAGIGHTLVNWIVPE